MFNKKYLFSCLMAVAGALVAIPALCVGYYAVFMIVTFLGN